MNAYQTKIILSKRTVIRIRIPLGRTAKIAHPLLWMLLLVAIAPCVVVSQQKIDTSELGMNKWFQERMRKSDLIVDAQVVSKESKWDSSKGGKGIYTTIKFKVFQTMKGVVENNEFSFDQPGGTVGNQSLLVENARPYNLNSREIFFFTKKFATVDGETIFGNTSTYGDNALVVYVGAHRVSAIDYIKILKQSVTDTMAFPKYYHGLKRADEEHRTGSLHLIKGPMPTRTTQENQRKQKDSSTTVGGVK